MKARTHTPFRDRFWKHVLPVPDYPGCWLWTASAGSHGYGQTTDDSGKVCTAHRQAYQMFRGAIPDGLLVRHTCDNRLCVNPDHLVVGTYADNSQDMVDRGRAPKGPTRGTHPKLNEADVNAIRRLHREGAPQREIRAAFRMSKAQVSKIINRQAWAWLQESA